MVGVCIYEQRQKSYYLLPHLFSRLHEAENSTDRKDTFRKPPVCVSHRVLTKDSLIVNQVKVNNSYRCPDTQQGQNNEPGEEAGAAAGPRVCLLPILIG